MASRPKLKPLEGTNYRMEKRLMELFQYPFFIKIYLLVSKNSCYSTKIQLLESTLFPVLIPGIQ